MAINLQEIKYANKENLKKIIDLLRATTPQQFTDEQVEEILTHLYEFEEYSEDEILQLFTDMDEETLQMYKNLIMDSVTSENKLWSSKKTSDSITQAIIDAQEYTDNAVANSGNLKKKIITSTTEVVDEQYLYLIETDADNHIYSQYMLIDGIVKELGNTSINLDNVYTKEEVDSELDLKANLDEVLTINQLVTALDDTVTHDQVPSALTFYEALELKLNKADLVDNLDSTETEKGLSANMGHVLSEEIKQMKLDFQAGVDSIYNACVEVGSTPINKTPTAIVEAILRLQGVSPEPEKWTKWVEAGGLDPSGFADLNNVLSDVFALDTLMNSHDAVDFLVEWLDEEVAVLHMIANDRDAMEYMGKYDYATITALANSRLAEVLLESPHWSYLLSDHVPTLTSNTSEGTAFSSNEQSAYPAYQAFDKKSDTIWATAYNASGTTAINQYIGYQFTKPIVIKKVQFTVGATADLLGNSAYCQPPKEFRVEGSNDGSTYTTIATLTNSNNNAGETIYFNIDNNEPYIYYRIYSINTLGGGTNTNLGELNFFGRFLKPLIPVMTANTDQGVTLTANHTYIQNNNLYPSFDGNNATNTSLTVATTTTITVSFEHKVKAIMAQFTDLNNGGAIYFSPGNSWVKGTNDNGDNVTELVPSFTRSRVAGKDYWKPFNNTTEFSSYQLFFGAPVAGYTATHLGNAQLWGWEFNEVEIKLEYYQEWLKKAELTPINYVSLDAVLQDTEALDVLMSTHKSVDFMVNWLTSVPEDLDVFMNNATAMEYISKYDYCADQMLANEITRTAILESPNWQLILKDSVPTQTANNSSILCSSEFSTSFSPWKAFDGATDTCWSPISNQVIDSYLGFKFEKPICVRKVEVTNSATSPVYAIIDYIVQASNDNTTWVDLGSYTNPSLISNASHVVNIDNNDNYIYYRILIKTSNADDTTANKRAYISALQFYGRTLSVSVPTLTADDGNIIYSSARADRGTPYGVFDKDITANGITNYWMSLNTGVPQHIGYNFGKSICVKQIRLANRNQGGSDENSYAPKTFTVQGSNDGNTWNDIKTITGHPNVRTTDIYYNFDNEKTYKMYRINITESYGNSDTASNTFASLSELDFYGADYSEVVLPSTIKDLLTTGGLNTEDYSDFSDILNDTEAMDTLMNNQEVVDQLVEWLPSDTEALNEVVNSTNAMTAIGNNDETANKLLNDPTIGKAIVESSQWQLVLKDNVPVLTSNSGSDGGNAIANSSQTDTPAWKAFNGTNNSSTDCWMTAQNAVPAYIGYKFAEPICVRKIIYSNRNGCGVEIFPIGSFVIQGSNNGTAWTDLKSTVGGSGISMVIGATNTINIVDNTQEFLYYRIYISYSDSGATSYPDNSFASVGELNFYGRH
jgi:hypothetical protein